MHKVTLWKKLLPLAAVVGGMATCHAKTKSLTEDVVTTASTSKVLAAWTELGPAGSVLVRSVVTTKTCPTVTVDGTALLMTTRVPAPAESSLNTCEASLPAGVKSAALDARGLPLPTAAVRKIVVLGDTGCRIKEAGSGKIKVQACNDPNAWALAKVATAAAAEKPDLVIHVGDYHYREAPCPTGDERCAGATSGDNWTSWNEDFFKPAAPLLAAAPWIFVRGNHELCDRAGGGWFQFLDPRPYSAGCHDATAPYVLNIGDRRLAVIDAASDTNIQPSLEQLAPSAGDGTWLLLHRPFLTPGADDETTAPPATLASAWRVPGKLAVILAGHQHRMAWNRFADDRPPELINGNGGTELEKPANADRSLAVTSGRGYTGNEFYEFGYAVLSRDADDSRVWTLEEHDRDGGTILHCTLKEYPKTKTDIVCD